MQNRFDEFRALLDLEQIELNIFRGQNERGQVGRLFGGQVLSQALMAAGRTVARLPAHSLHGYFLRPGDPSVLESTAIGRFLPSWLALDRRCGAEFVITAVPGRQNPSGCSYPPSRRCRVRWRAAAR